MEATVGTSPARPSGCKSLRRQRSRLQMQAPSSIQVRPADASQWKLAIPLLSPLDSSPLSDLRDPAHNEAATQQQQQQQAEWKRAAEGQPENGGAMRWQHPAAPFYYETVPPGNAPAFAEISLLQ